ncbi:hypothetical protein [Micromonospora cremea]|uniref:Uncharacterized protein n=1 Tax=Micromonospora cremea TaxID=709881 RepID=A0A1N5TJS1_9ACTN|nr:hypothetical protein [Micromonospora cremea]SIM48289.1 hypothetical protein SAMN04489832_0198 [Micromonospora cremea]
MISAANPSASQFFAAAAQHHAEFSTKFPEGPASFHSFLADIRQSQASMQAPGPLGAAILLTPLVMCVVGAVAIALFAKNPNPAPGWMREVWATWMIVACVALLPALIYARFRSRR